MKKTSFLSISSKVKIHALELVLGIVMIFAIISCDKENNNHDEVQDVTIKWSYYHDPISVSFAKISIWGGASDISGQIIQNSEEENNFEYSVSLIPNKEYTFNIETRWNSICDENNSEYVAFKNGIRAKEVKVNDKIIDNSFLFDNNKGGSNFIFKIDKYGKVYPGGGTALYVNENIPPEIWFLNQKILLKGSNLTDKFANAWFTVIHDTKKGGQSKVEIENLKLFAKLNNGEDLLLASNLFNDKWYGKLYVRYPYFLCSKEQTMQWEMPARIIEGKLEFYPSEVPNRVWLGWCSDIWAKIPSNTNKLWIESEVRITGNALMQIGVDVKSNQVNSDSWEGYGVSNWFFESQNFQKIYFNL